MTQTVETDWKEFLRRQGANDVDSEVKDLGDIDAERRALTAETVLVDLSPYSLIDVSGADAAAFLNGQLTNDVALLDPTNSQLSAWCSAKGRMLVVFRVWRSGENYVLQLPRVLRDDILKRLRMYVLRSKVVLTPKDDSFVRFGIAGADAAKLLGGLTEIPQRDNNRTTANGIVAMRLPGMHPRFQIIAPIYDAIPLWEQLIRDARPVGTGAWTWHDVMAGLPIVLPQTSEMFVPQMANLDLLDGISFKKGCYTGQEIVARVHYLGRLKQRMYRTRIQSNDLPAPGTEIFGVDRADQSTGNVMLACASPAGGCDLLAVVHTSSVEAGKLHTGRPDGPLMTIEPLPYRVT